MSDGLPALDDFRRKANRPVNILGEVLERVNKRHDLERKFAQYVLHLAAMSLFSGRLVMVLCGILGKLQIQFLVEEDANCTMTKVQRLLKTHFTVLPYKVYLY